MTDDLLQHYGMTFVNYNIKSNLHITFQEFLTQPYVYIDNALEFMTVVEMVESVQERIQ